MTCTLLSSTKFFALKLLSIIFSVSMCFGKFLFKPLWSKFSTVRWHTVLHSSNKHSPHALGIFTKTDIFIYTQYTPLHSWTNTLTLPLTHVSSTTCFFYFICLAEFISRWDATFYAIFRYFQNSWMHFPEINALSIHVRKVFSCVALKLINFFLVTFFKIWFVGLAGSLTQAMDGWSVSPPLQTKISQ